MNFLEIFKDVTACPIMLVTKVTNVTLKPATNTMQVNFTVPYELSEDEKYDLTSAIMNAYSVNGVDAIYTVEMPEFKTKQPKPQKEYKEPDDGITIKGKKIKKKQYTEISDVNENSGSVFVTGKIIKILEPKKTKNDKTLYRFEVAGKDTFIMCKSFLKEEESEYVTNNLKEGMFVSVGGKAQFDTFDNAVIIMANNISVADEPEDANLYTGYKKPDDGKTIKGKPITGGVYEKIANIDQYSGNVLIKGAVITVAEPRTTKSGKVIYKFDITDKTSSISCKCFLDAAESEFVIGSVKAGMYLSVAGRTQFDSFDNETVIMVNDISKSEAPVYHDDYEGKKRVELHLHTKMSMMDSVLEIDKAVERAAQWGQKAIAVTDHGVVQSFPDALDAGKKYGVKIIYGVEGYLIDDSSKAVKGEDKMPFGGTFVAFDIETTGLSPLTCSIIEIGAVKIVDGQMVESFNEMIDPGFDLPEFTTNLTGITTEMVKSKPKIDEVLPKFLEFVGNFPVIAHNAQFDYNFIKCKCEPLNLTFNNTCIDTLEMSRHIYNELKKHKLDTLAKHLKINMGSHHRACDDANTCAAIFLKMIENLRENNLNDISQINDYLGDTDYKQSKTHHIIILVKTQKGMKNLYKIISESHLNYFYKTPRIPRKILDKYREGLIVGSACEAGELFSAVVSGIPYSELLNIAKYYDYLEIQPIGNNRFMLDNGTVDSVEQLQEFNKTIVRLAKDLNKPYVATCDSHFLDPDDSIFRAIIQAGQGYKDADRQAPLYFRSTSQMLDEFDYLDEETRINAVINNTNLIADMTDDDLAPIPKKQYAPKIEGAEDDVRNISFQTANEIYGDRLPEFVRKRMDKELHSIIDNGFSVMYVIAQRLVWKSNEDGYLVGSRGSVGSSFIAFLMKITEVNSLPPHYVCPKCKYNKFFTKGEYACGIDLPDAVCPECGEKLNKDGHDIPFETFLGFHGEKDPDIDLNFSGEYQSQVHKYTEKIFGHDHVFKAGTISTLADKTAYGYVVNYLAERNITANNAEKNRLTLGCAGVKKTTGQHPGGMVVVPDDMDIYDFCPIHRPADKDEADFITTHFDYGKMKGTLLKFDELGHDDPTVLKMLGDITGQDVTKIPLDDKKVMSLFSSNEALGYKPEYIHDGDFIDQVGTYAVPEFGTQFVRQMLIDTKPDTFGELIRISGLSHGTNVWVGNAKDLVDNGIASLKEVICTRDDIMINLMHWGLDSKDAFDIMEFTRKGKFKQHKDLIPVMEEHNVPQWYIDSCLKISYMFPKAHAAAYVTMAFRIAWFKVYKPIAFYRTYFTVRADVFDSTIMTKGIDKVREAIGNFKNSDSKLSAKDNSMLTILEVVNEMYTRGFEFAQVDLYKSDATKFLETEDGKILPPLSSMGGLGENAAKAIASVRDEGEFMSIEDLRIRTGINKTAIEVLRTEGCLNGLDETAQMTFFGI